MLSAYSFVHHYSFVKKKIHKFVGKWLLGRTKLHATTENEWTECQQILPGWKGFIAPNLVVMPTDAYPRKKHSKLALGTLSRIDPVKNLDSLFRALENAPFPYSLLVAGSGEESYLAELRLMAHRLGIEDNITWMGWQKAEEKYAFLANLDVLVLVSHTENFANVVVEALAVGTPVLISTGVGLHNTVANQQWGWVTGTGPAEIKQSLVQIVQSPAEVEKVKDQLANRVRDFFSPKHIVSQYLSAYQQ
jgi:glycosyltransferase involved in cell wall biosynthesis